MSGISQKKSIEDFSLKSLTLTEINRVLIRIGALLSQSHGVGQNVNVHGGRITNVGNATQDNDAINKVQMDEQIAEQMASSRVGYWPTNYFPAEYWP